MLFQIAHVVVCSLPAKVMDIRSEKHVEHGAGGAGDRLLSVSRSDAVTTRFLTLWLFNIAMENGPFIQGVFNP